MMSPKRTAFCSPTAPFTGRGKRCISRVFWWKNKAANRARLLTKQGAVSVELLDVNGDTVQKLHVHHQ